MNARDLIARLVDKWPVKVMSVAEALALLVFHRMSTVESRFFLVPLHIESGETGLVAASPYPRFARVTLRGEAASIYPILESDIEAYVEAAKYTAEDWYNLPLRIRKTGSAVGVEPLEISVDPMKVSIRLEHRMSKTVTLVPAFRGRVSQGYDLVSLSLSPATVLVEGPEHLLGGVSEFQTDVIDLDGRSQDFSVFVNIINDEHLVIIRGNGVVEFRGQVRKSADIHTLGEDVPQ